MSSNIWLLCLVALLPVVSALKCYDCYGTGPDHKECSKERSCHGIACMIFDAGDNKTASAFCLLAMKGQKMEEQKDGCWLEPDGKGKHCMCFSDYCNKLVDRRDNVETDPMTPILPDAQFLKQNPLVDYDTPKLDGEDDDDDNGAVPMPSNVMFPGAAKQDSHTAGGSDDDDLVPVNFEDYKDTAEKNEDKTDRDVVEPIGKNSEDEARQLPNDIDKPELQNNEISEVSGAHQPPAWVLIVFPMAASWARFFAGF